jgi:hypothetical protein
MQIFNRPLLLFLQQWVCFPRARISVSFIAALSNAALRYTFLAPSVSTLLEPIININSNFKTKNMF